MKLLFPALAFAVFLASGCGGDDGGAGSTASSSGGGGSTSGTASGGAGGGPAIGGDRPVEVHVPPGLGKGEKAPLVVMLHGYGVNGAVEEVFLGLQPFADQKKFFYAHPDGTIDSMGSHFWNATDACCDMDHTGVDDSGYLASVIHEIEAAYPVDSKRVYVVGHSNGAFMAYRMACDHADLIAGIGSLAGAMWQDVSRCKPSRPVSVLEMHGTADTEVIYDGSTVENYPSAETSVLDWAGLDGCATTPKKQPGALDLDTGLHGKETDIERFPSCHAGTAVELWTINGGSHIPNFTPAFQPTLLDWLLAKHAP